MLFLLPHFYYCVYDTKLVFWKTEVLITLNRYSETLVLQQHWQWWQEIRFCLPVGKVSDMLQSVHWKMFKKLLTPQGLWVPRICCAGIHQYLTGWKELTLPILWAHFMGTLWHICDSQCWQRASSIITGLGSKFPVRVRNSQLESDFLFADQILTN